MTWLTANKGRQVVLEILDTAGTEQFSEFDWYSLGRGLLTDFQLR